MTRTRRLSVVLAVLALALASPRATGQSLQPGAFGPAVTPGRLITVADLLATNPLPPSDIYRPSGIEGARHYDLATFAWLEFIALNAPADPGTRTLPSGSFADTGFAPDSTTVWQSYYHRAELFPYGGGVSVPPVPANGPPTYVYGVGDPRRTYQVPFQVANNLDEATQIGQNVTFFPVAGGGAEQLFYEAKANYVEWDYINSNSGLQLASIQKSPVDGQLFYDPPISQPTGVMEVKAGWRRLSSIPEDEQHRYLVASEAVYYTGTDDDPVAQTDAFALTSLHIIIKTENYPTFIFATFEQIDALVSPSGPTGMYYIPTYESTDYTLPEGTYLTSIDETIPTTAIVFDVEEPFSRPNGIPVPLPPNGPVTNIPGAQVFPDGVHIPVVQPPTTNSSVRRVNRRVYQQMELIPGFDESFVWQYYKLKGVQAIPTNDETARDFYLGDISIESSQPGIQLFRGGAIVEPGTDSSTLVLKKPRNNVNTQDPKQSNNYFNMGGCMGCHGVAQTRNGFDFSFLYKGANGNGFAIETEGLPSQAVIRDRLQRLKGIHAPSR